MLFSSRDLEETRTALSGWAFDAIQLDHSPFRAQFGQRAAGPMMVTEARLDGRLHQFGGHLPAPARS